MNYASNTIRVISAEGQAVGTGILISPKHILTCTHIVAAAQGDPEGRQVDMTGEVRFDMPLLHPREGAADCLATPIVCKPALAEPRIGDLADISVLQIRDPSCLPSGAEPARLEKLDHTYDRKTVAFGFHRWKGDHVKLSMLAMDATGAIQIEQRPDYPEVKQGFSGAAVCDTETWSVLGMLVRRDQASDVRTAYMIPAVQLLVFLREARIKPLLVDPPLPALSSEPVTNVELRAPLSAPPPDRFHLYATITIASGLAATLFAILAVLAL